MGFSWLLIQFRNNIQKYSKKTTFIGFGYVWSEGLTHIQTHMDRLQIKTILMICTRGSYSAYKWLFNEYIPTCACKFKKASDDFCLLLLSFFFVRFLSLHHISAIFSRFCINSSLSVNVLLLILWPFLPIEFSISIMTWMQFIVSLTRFNSLRNCHLMHFILG